MDIVVILQVVVGHEDARHHQPVLHLNICGDCSSDNSCNPGAVASTERCWIDENWGNTFLTC